MEMLEIMKSRMPKGLEVIRIWDRNGSDQIKILFSYEGHQHYGWLRKTCTPGFAEKNCDFSICTVMIGIALERNDLEMVKHWKEKQDGIYRVF